MSERHCPKCEYRWNGAYNMDGKCTSCGTLTRIRSTVHALRIARVGNHNLPAPEAASSGAAALDIRITEDVEMWPGDELVVGTGFAYEPPQGYALFLLPRSGLGTMEGVVLGNLVGLVDPDYRGELKVALWYRRAEGPKFCRAAGDRIAQLVCAPILSPSSVEVVDYEDLSQTERGEGGFGSSGRG